MEVCDGMWDGEMSDVDHMKNYICRRELEQGTTKGAQSVIFHRSYYTTLVLRLLTIIKYVQITV